MAIDRSRAARGAVAGAAAAGVWLLQQPLDAKLFGVPYYDHELLGKAVTRRPAWRPVGAGAHLVNGALFGAVYATLAPRVSLPGWARGAAAGLAEHVALWPLVGLTDRVHPARDELPSLSGSVPAFLQATWRHLLFGVTLGELERRLNPPEPEPVEEHDGLQAYVSTNGHGDIRRAFSERTG
jgi:hypothetical protein